MKILALFLLMTCLLAGCGKATQTVTEATITSDGFKKITVSGISFEWRVTQNVNLEGRVSAPTDGWVAVGFKPDTQMLNANIIIGYVDSAAHVVDGFGNGTTSWTPDGQNNLLTSSGTSSSGVTTIRFTIPLNSGDSQDRAIASGETFPICLAYGSMKSTSNQSTNQHQSNTRATTSITL